MPARTFTFKIPIRPKAVQSTRFTGNYSYVDPKVKKWKAAVTPYVEFYKPESPSQMPFEIVEAIYTFKLPKSLSKKVLKKVEEEWAAGRDVPYLSTPDLTDNIHKGISDVITACQIWVDDKQVWRVAPDAVIKKVYGKEDFIQVTVRETPDVLLIDGRTAEEAYGEP